ncbi:uncharacterized protein LOC131231659 isoform X2 [Magnolia sinica]|uniref:uncharacterized protein LOC131231659 isoform X2 n=1 Tax=Magnolia sinica TaxID=86752 RepID=UPI002657E0E8|nr:uncharacterized protein LOC131231659 isoform X2 [Magnolia sinica]XP_058083917.1 uncharacterized protein LOC131231659 isoform X2 [Magnolia sinica]
MSGRCYGRAWISTEIKATQGENATQVKSTCSSPFPIIKIPLQMDKEPQDNVLEPVTTHPNTSSMEKETNHQSKNDFEEGSDFELHEDGGQENDAWNPEGCGENVLTRQGNGNDLQEFFSPQPLKNAELPNNINPVCGNEGPVIRTNGDENEEDLSDLRSVEDVAELSTYHYLPVGEQIDEKLR